jgi:hypothetical protein
VLILPLHPSEVLPRRRRRTPPTTSTRSAPAWCPVGVVGRDAAGDELTALFQPRRHLDRRHL